MKVFVTGATGFIGHHVAKALAAEGASLRLLTRKSSNLANLEGIPGETVVGEGSTIGASVFLTRSVPPHSLVTFDKTDVNVTKKVKPGAILDFQI